MYLYIPMDGRSIVVGEYTISSTGAQFDEPIKCLEEVVGNLLKRVTDVTPKAMPLPIPKAVSIPA